MARLVVSAAAAAVGFYFGGPVVALQTFSLVYGATGFLDPNSKVLGPKLADLKAPAASYGAPIPYVEGAMRLPGCYIWASEKHEIANTETQGKGGPGVDSTTFTYEIDVLIELAINRCVGVRRIWSNGRLVWNTGSEADAETITASSTTNSWRDWRFYGGADDQLPDPVYEAAVGVGNAPAYRGRTTVFIEGLNLGGSGQLPVLTFEVMTESEGTFSVVLDAALTGGGGLPTNSTPHFTAGDGYTIGIGQWDISYTNDQVVWWHVDPSGAAEIVATTNVGANYTGITHNALRGQSDEPCWVNGEDATPDITDVGPLQYRVPDSAAVLTFERTGLALDGAEQSIEPVFAKRGNLFVYGPYLTYDFLGYQPKTIKLFNFTTQVFIRATDDILGPDGFWDIAISLDGTKIYAVTDSADPHLFEFDVASGEINQSVSLLSLFPFGPLRVMVDEDDGTVYVVGTNATYTDGAIYRLDGAVLTFVVGGIDQLGPNSYYSQHGVAGGFFYTLHGATADSHEIYKGSFREDPAEVTLDQVVRRLCLRTGLLTDDDIDVTDLASDIVHGMAVTQVSTTRVTLEMLMAAYLFESVEAETLKFVKRGGASVATIPYEDLAASQGGAEEPLPIVRRNDIEIAARVSVKYANFLNDYQDGLEQADRLVTESTAEAVVELPIALTPTEAARLADANTMDAAVSLLAIGPIALPRKYARLEPTDVITVTDQNGDTFRTRIVKGTIGGGIYKFDLVLDDATVINSEAETDSDYSSSTLIRVVASTELELLDIPILRDADDSPGFYAAFKGVTDAWPGAELDKSLDDVTYTKLLDVGDQAVMGTAPTALPDFTGGNVFDEVGSLTVDVGDGTLSSSTRDILLTTDTNALLVGAEIIQFRSASLLSPGVYLLTGLLRGRRGTEWAMPDHVDNERVVLLRTASGIRKVSENAAEIGTAAYYKAVTHGKSRAAVTGVAFTDTGVALKPFAPVDLRYDAEAGSISWHRRSRLSSRFLAPGIDPPLGEAVEVYDYELRDGSDVLVASGSVSSPEYEQSGLVEDSAAFVGVGFTPGWGKKTIGGVDIMVADNNIAPNSAAAHGYLIRIDGTAPASTPGGALGIGNTIFQFVNNSTALYVTTDDFFATYPYPYKNSKVQRFTVATLDTQDAENVASTPGDYKGLAFDGTDVWIAEYLSGNLRRLNATTLVSIAAYAITGSPWAMVYATGKLFVTCIGTDEIVCFDTTAHTETWRVATTSDPSDVLVVGSLVFVAGATIDVHDKTTGAAVVSHAFPAASTLPQRVMSVFGSYVAVLTATGILLLDSTTGAQVDLLSYPTAEVHFIAGEFGSDLGLMVADTSGGSRNTRLYTVAPPGLAGYSFTVMQRSATVGDGYPATLEL